MFKHIGVVDMVKGADGVFRAAQADLEAALVVARGNVAQSRLGKVLGRFHSNQSGMIQAVVSVILIVIVLGALIPALWPKFSETATNIAALTQTDAGTETLQSLWPIALVVVGIGIAAGIVFMALHKFGVMD